ncbi:MAG: phosphotransferase [Clostridia bacterium]|nr:phosphotransferase [Clostridia bacterium]
MEQKEMITPDFGEAFVDCSQLRPIGKGVTAVTYVLDDGKVIKAYRKGVPLPNIEAERRISETLYGHGIDIPECFGTVRTDEWYGNIYRRLHGGTFTAHLLNAAKEGRGFAEWIGKYAALAKHFNGVRAEEGILSCKDLFRKELEISAPYLSAEDRLRIRDIWERIPDTENLLHGDMSTGNIMIDGDDLYFIDLATVAKGHPVFDLTVPYMVLNMWPRFAKTALEMPVEERTREKDWFAYLNRYPEKALPEADGAFAWKHFLKEYFTLDSAADPWITQISDLVRCIAMAKYSMSGSFRSIYPEHLVRKMSDFYSAELRSCKSPEWELLNDDRWNLQKAR